MVAAVHGKYLAPPGDLAGHPHGVFIGIRSAVGEEHLVQVARCHTGDPASQLPTDIVRDPGLDRTETTGLRLNGGDEIGVLMPEIQVDQLR